jgi:hypothetical protein
MAVLSLDIYMPVWQLKICLLEVDRRFRGAYCVRYNPVRKLQTTMKQDDYEILRLIFI